MKWKVAPSYSNAVIEEIDESVKKAYVSETCYKCGGSGIYAWFGTCFACGGAGKRGKWVKIYTEDEYNQYIKNQERAKEKRIQKEEERKQDLINKSEENKKELLLSFGYDPKNPYVYLVVGENTYSIKDELKAAGARFDSALGWYISHEIEVPAGYTLVKLPFDEVFDWNPLVKKISLKEGAAAVAETAIAETLPKSSSEYVGTIKEKIQNIEVTLISTRTIDGYYGTSCIYTFKEGENVIIWITSSTKYNDIKAGEHFTLSGTVKDHKLYKGIKQTIMTRCTIKVK